MDVLTSTEFRKRYASLRRETSVTVNGHLIGHWLPADLVIAPFVSDPHTPEREAEIAARHPERTFAEFRPVPKPGRR
jgi:hypothetical protein